MPGPLPDRNPGAHDAPFVFSDAWGQPAGTAGGKTLRSGALHLSRSHAIVV